MPRDGPAYVFKAGQRIAPCSGAGSAYGQLRAIAPDAFTEGQLDLHKLGQLTGNVAADGPERFSFTWAGKKQTIWRVTDPEREQSFHICLDDTLSVEAVRALGLTREDLFVCRDKSLDDTLAANLALQCRLKVL